MSPAVIFSINAAATFPLRCASRPASSSKVSNIAKEDGPSLIAYHEIVPGSAFTKGTADRRKSATSFSLSGLASSGTYNANFVILLSCSDLREYQSASNRLRQFAIISDVTFECEFGSGKQTYRDIRLSLCGKAAGGCTAMALHVPPSTGLAGARVVLTGGEAIKRVPGSR